MKKYFTFLNLFFVVVILVSLCNIIGGIQTFSSIPKVIEDISYSITIGHKDAYLGGMEIAFYKKTLIHSSAQFSFSIIAFVSALVLLIFSIKKSTAIHATLSERWAITKQKREEHKAQKSEESKQKQIEELQSKLEELKKQ